MDDPLPVFSASETSVAPLDLDIMVGILASPHFTPDEELRAADFGVAACGEGDAAPLSVASAACGEVDLPPLCVVALEEVGYCYEDVSDAEYDSRDVKPDGDTA